MATEIEKKYRLNSAGREKVLEGLKEFGAEYEGEDFEENTIFGGGALNGKPAVLRLRKTQSKTVLAYKQRIPNDSDVKHQIEFETEVKDVEAMENIIANIGFTKSLVYEKRRKTWRFRQVEVVLDELPFGSFMEIEGSLTAIKEAEMLLDIEDFPVEYETYPRLTLKLGARRGEVVEARFP